MSLNLYQITWHYIPKDGTLQKCSNFFRNLGKISIFHTLRESTMGQKHAALEYAAGLERLQPLQLTVISQSC
jgi:hypothetical protein